MKGTVLARVRRVLTGHSDRSLIHAVDDNNLETKIEVPTDVLRDLMPGQDYALVLSWTLQPLVMAPAPQEAAATPAPARAPTPLPSAVDEEFMALMDRRRGPTGAGPTSAGRPNPPPLASGAPVVASAAEQLAQRLGIRPGRPTS